MSLINCINHNKIVHQIIVINILVTLNYD